MPVSRCAAAELGLYTALSVYFTWPLLATGAALGIEDWDALLFQHGAVLKSVMEYGRLPFWNPWYCGGNVLWQNPQAALLSPVYFFATAVDLAVAMKITITLHYVAGFAGMYVLLRRVFRVDTFAWRLFLAGLFTMAGAAALHLAIGHATFLAYFYLPWALWLFLTAAASGTLKHAAGAGAVLALAIFNGGIYVVVMTAVAFAVLAAGAAAVRRDWRPLGVLGFTGVMAGLLAAPKFVPVLLFAAWTEKVDIRTLPPGPDVMSALMLLTSLAAPFQTRDLAFDAQKYGWAEYGNYLGPFGAVAVAAALVWIAVGSVRARSGGGERPGLSANQPATWLPASLAVTALLMLLIAAGDFAALAPYSMLRSLPGFEDLRVPSRYLLVFNLFAAAAVASAIGAAGAGRRARALSHPGLAAILVLGTLGLAYQNRQMFAGAFPFASLDRAFRWGAAPPPPVLDPHTDGWAPGSPMLRGLMSNQGVLRCNEPFHLRGHVRPDEPILFGDAGAVVSDIGFLPDRIDFAVSTEAGGWRVIMNQRYAPGWRSSAGPVAIDPWTRLAYVALAPASTGHYAFTFTPPGLGVGMALAGLGVLLAAGCWRRRL